MRIVYAAKLLNIRQSANVSCHKYTALGNMTFCLGEIAIRGPFSMPISIRGYDLQDSIYVCADELVPGYIDTTYVETHVLPNGCDSIINHNYITVDWEPDFDSFQEITSCGFLEFRGYTEPGVYVDTLRRFNGCYTQTIDLKFENRDTLSKTICKGNSYLGYDETGVYGYRIRNGFCDSLRVINLIVEDPPTDCVQGYNPMSRRGVSWIFRGGNTRHQYE